MQKAEFDQLPVNRSLSSVEYEFMRQMNAYLDKSVSRSILDRYLEETPEIASEKEMLGEKMVVRFIEKNGADVEYINQFLNDEDKLKFLKPKSAKKRNGIFEIGKKQIEAFSESISKQFKVSNKPVLVDEDADRLRDIASKYETNDTITLEDAVYLMTIASKIRPNGPIIKHKLKSYQTELASRNTENSVAPDDTDGQ